MLHKDFEQRFGCIVIQSEDGSRLKNDEIRSHPFMRGFPWKAMIHRTLLVSAVLLRCYMRTHLQRQAPNVPKRIPDLSEEWHKRPLHRQKDIPGLPRVRPQPHVQWDDRFMTKKRKMRRERMRERSRERRDDFGESRPSKMHRIVAWNAEVNRKRETEEGDEEDVEEPRIERGEALRRAKEVIKKLNAEFARAAGRAPPSPTPVEPETQAAEDPVPQEEQAPVKVLFNIPGRELRPVREDAPPRAEPLMPPPIFQPVLNVATGTQPDEVPQATSEPSHTHEPLENSPHKFKLPVRVPKAEPEFKEPWLPERVIVNEFNKLSVSEPKKLPAKSGQRISRKHSSKNVMRSSGGAGRRRKKGTRG